MKLADRDRRALTYLGVSLVLGLVYQFWPQGSITPAAATTDSVEITEQRLARMREIAATVSAKEEVLKKVAGELAVREQGLIREQTGPQAQAQVITVMRRLLSQETPPIEIRSTEVGPLAPLGDQYGAAVVSVQFECQVAQLINFLASLEATPELISTRDFQIRAANAKTKTVQVRLTVAGAVPKNLIPDRDKKGVAGF